MPPPSRPFICAILPANPSRHDPTLRENTTLINHAPTPDQVAIHPPAPLILRPMMLDDVDNVMDIESQVYTQPWSARGYRHELTRNDLAHYQVLLWDDGAEAPLLVGYTGYWLIVDEVHISTIVVRPDWRGRGLGELLFLNALLQASAQGATIATLEVRRTNLVAQLLYKKYDFVVMGERPHYYNDNGEDALVMTLEPLDDIALANLRRHWTILRARLQTVSPSVGERVQ
ncbi:MAG: ribosomal protein S18-alanine N-acetyltransferase [Ardenticatenales bacterium]|nr:ribosomal protein S18-alanine N-acetyltransferase [Ardenticatenales bacterium]